MSPAPKFPQSRVYPTAPAPNDDVSAVGGNCTPEQKQWSANLLAHFNGHKGPAVFGQNVLNNIKLVEMNLNKRKLGSTDGADRDEYEGQQIYELKVDEGMPNSDRSELDCASVLTESGRDVQCTRPYGWSCHGTSHRCVRSVSTAQETDTVD